MTNTFQDLGLTPEILQTLETLGYVEPTPIQDQAIPHLLEGRDVLGQAQTGTGKTAAFTLPIIQRIEGRALQTLILAPTRELAIQVAESVHRYGNAYGVRVLPIYGGQSYDRQIRRLKKGVQVVVGTPGRTLDLIKKGVLDTRKIRFVVLDEADEMLKMGFIEDIEAILGATDAETRQTTLFSATFSPEILRLSNNYMHDAVRVMIQSEEATATNVNQRYYMVQERDKIAALSRMLEVENMQNTLIFARTKVGSAELAETLLERGYPAVAIHGDLSQNERERILTRFRSGQLTILVATDVMARGVDIPHVSHVINYDIPQLAIEYVHRIGRTGRAGRAGEAITFITPRQRRSLKMIESYIGKSIDKAKLPDRSDVLRRRREQFKAALIEQIETNTFDLELLDELFAMGIEPEYIAAGMLNMLQQQEKQRPLEEIGAVSEREERSSRRERGRSDRRNGGNGNSGGNGGKRGKRGKTSHEAGMVRLTMQIGRNIGLRPGDVVYNIASKSNIPGHVIGAIDIRDTETYLDIPHDHVDAVLRGTKNARFRGQPLRLAVAHA